MEECEDVVWRDGLAHGCGVEYVNIIVILVLQLALRSLLMALFLRVLLPIAFLYF